MSDQNLTEQQNPRSEMLDEMDIPSILKLMNTEDHTVPAAVEAALPQIEPAVTAIVDVMQNGGRLFYVGAGTSGRLGVLDASECPPTFGVPPELVTGLIAGGDSALRTAVEGAEDRPEPGARDITERVTKNDAVVGLAASGQTPYILGAMRAAGRIGAVTVGISCNRHTPLSQIVQFPIEVLVGPEIITGSTRLKAGTAQKLVLNMISTTVMIQTGKVYGNLMVNVQASNQKLRQRVVRIIRTATGVDAATARHFSQAADGDARVAILMIEFGLEATVIRQALQQNRDHFRNTRRQLLAQS